MEKLANFGREVLQEVANKLGSTFLVLSILPGAFAITESCRAWDQRSAAHDIECEPNANDGFTRACVPRPGLSHQEVYKASLYRSAAEDNLWGAAHGAELTALTLLTSASLRLVHTRLARQQ